MSLESHHFLFDTDKSITLFIDQFLNVNNFGLSSAVRPTDRLKLSCGIPRGCSNIDTCRLLEIETLTTTLDLDDENSSRCSLFETLNLPDALLLGYRTINSEHGTVKLRLNVVHLTPKLTENERLF